MNWNERRSELDLHQRTLLDTLSIEAEMNKQTWQANLRAANHDPSMFTYYGYADFLLQHGEWFVPKKWAFDFHKGVDSMCFGNALLLAGIDNLAYVEGVALSPFHPFGIHHAWNAESDGRLVDNTWLNTGRAYLGVRFSPGRADDATWFNNASILNNLGDQFDLFRRPWEGEDFTREWKMSPGFQQIRDIRDGRMAAPRRTMRKVPTEVELRITDVIALPGKHK